MTQGFKLQSVLNYRQSLEDQAQQVLAESLQQQNELSAQIEVQQLELRQQDLLLKKQQQDGMTIAEIELYETRIIYCQQRCAELHRQKIELQELIEHQRQQLLEAARERQIMEKLKEKQQTEFRRDLERKERAELDEISLRIRGEKL